MVRKPSILLNARTESRKRVLAWTDAAGVSRIIAAVLYFNGRWFYTRIRVPDHVWSQLLPRRDNQITMQEFLAVPLLLATFAAPLRQSMALLAVDNQGVLGALISGRAGVDDLNMGIGKTWLMIAEAGLALHVVRVESNANIADGPTREDLGPMEEVGADFVNPVLPDWVRQLWHWPA